MLVSGASPAPALSTSAGDVAAPSGWEGAAKGREDAAQQGNSCRPEPPPTAQPLRQGASMAGPLASLDIRIALSSPDVCDGHVIPGTGLQLGGFKGILGTQHNGDKLSPNTAGKVVIALC